MGCATAEYLKKRGMEFCLKTKNAPLPPKGDAIIDFSAPEALDEVLYYALQTCTPLVIGVTGHSGHQADKIKFAAEKIPIMYESNFSRGIFALKRALCVLKKILPDWESAIVEIHRNGKKDRPSGTALTLNTVMRASEMHSLRLGQDKGTHEILLYGDGEKITLTHSADSFEAFCSGAVLAAEKLVNMPNGLVTFDQILEK